MSEAQFAAELRAFARRLRLHSLFDSGVAEVARAMRLRASELAAPPRRRRMRMTTITVGRRTVTVQKPRAQFGL